MQKPRGFTVVEVAVVMAIMTLLLTIGVVSYRGYQSNARDRERAADVAAIATHLETIYSRVIMDGSTVIKPAGSYPSRNSLNSTTRQGLVLDGLLRSALYAPGHAAQAFSISTNGYTTAGDVSPAPSTTVYVYVPLDTDGSLCLDITVECRAFRVFYRNEKNEDITVESKRK